MATVYPSRTCLPKFICSILVVGLFTAGVLITGAYPHPDLINPGLEFNNQTNSGTSKHNLNQAQNEMIASARLEAIQASNQLLQTQLEQALARIEHNVQRNKELAERISRSPRAIKTIQALDAAIAIFGQNEQKPEFQISEYATGNRRWKRAPSVHPVPITDLLEYDIQNHHNHNRILGDKVAQILQQNTNLSDEISKAYQTPSEKLKKDLIMALVTKMVATYMFLKHNNGAQRYTGTEDFSLWGEPFFKKKE
jgi:hypothetical protein